MPMPMPSPAAPAGGPPAPGGMPGGAPGGAPMGGTGAVSAPRPMMGNAAQALSQVHFGLEALQKSLVGLPMGSEIHTAVLKAITDISKRLNNDQGDSSSKIQQMVAMARDAQQNPRAAALQRMQPGQGGPPPTPAMPGA